MQKEDFNGLLNVGLFQNEMDTKIQTGKNLIFPVPLYIMFYLMFILSVEMYWLEKFFSILIYLRNNFIVQVKQCDINFCQH